jgi:ABC-type amino acid transport substrate-binding protein
MLQVGVIVALPVYIKTAGNRWEGLSVELWQAVAQRMDAPFEFREFSSLESVVDALGKKEIDVIPAISVQDRYEAVDEGHV